MGIQFVTRANGEKMMKQPSRPGRYVLDVSSRGKDGWNVLSPMFDHGEGSEKKPIIPVPGMPGTFSRTVEAIWQGLKVFPVEPGQNWMAGTDLKMLESDKPRKRKGIPLGHVYEGEIITGQVPARKALYLPAYHWMIRNCPLATAKYQELLELSKVPGNMVYVYDFDSNGDPEVKKPLAHAAVLAMMVQEELKGKPLSLAK